MMEIDIQFILLLVAVFCAYKIGYWNGRKDATQWAIDQVHGIFLAIKKIGDAHDAKQLRKD
jgi:hypothetical protein